MKYSACGKKYFERYIYAGTPVIESQIASNRNVKVAFPLSD